MEEAELQAREAVEIDPLSAAAQFTLGRVLFYAGKLNEADAAGRKMAELQPSASSSHRWQVLVAVQRGDGEAALREAQLEPDESIRAFRTSARTIYTGRQQGIGRGVGRSHRQFPG